MTKTKKFVFFGIIFVVLLIGCLLFFCKKESVLQDLTIVFNKSGNVSEYKTTGFSQPETNFTWTDGEEASIEIPLPDVQENVFLRVSFDACPFVAKKTKKRTVKVFVNDEFIKDFVMTECSDNFVFDLPHDLQKLGEKANIKFRISSAKSPKELKLSNDSRKLGISIKKMVLSAGHKDNPEAFSVYKIGNIIDFSSKGNSLPYAKTGWSRPEQNFTWIDGRDAYMGLFVKNPTGKILRLDVEGKGIFDPVEKSQKVTVFVNDIELTTWDVSSEFATYSVKIPEKLVETGALQIRFHVAKPVSLKTDPRKLGFAVVGVKISSIFGAKTKNKMANWFKNKVLDSEAEQQTENNK